MFLESIRLQRFRSCHDAEISLQPDLTVLVGENNGGKTNVIDAIRLLIMPLTGRRDRYPEEEDLRRGSAERDFRIQGRFSGLSDALKGLLVSALPDPRVDVAFFGLRHEIRSAEAPRGKTTPWVGRFDNAEPESGSTNLIRHVYLPPLRDAQQALGTGSATRIAALLQHFLEDGEEANFIEHVRRNQEPHRVITAVNDEIGSALGNLTGGVRPQASALGFADEKLLDVARDLRFKMADVGIAPEEIRSSGLGYANLLYIATVAVELARAREADLTLFLVEEPEAHLHPQLQMLVLNFLLEQAQGSLANPAPGAPEGRVQVIVTTHSPNLTAWVSPKHLVVIRSKREEGGAQASPQTVCIPIAKIGLRPASLNKISRYLDVTRSALLFGNRALLVEGVAEALLLPVIARHVVLKDDHAGWLRFQGSVFVPIGGVDFKPYVEVLLRPYAGARIADSIVVVTYADPTVPGNRKNELEELAAELGGHLEVFVNEQTLEHELFLAGNETLLKNTFLAIHRNSGPDWAARVEAVQERDRPAAFLTLLDTKKTRKGDLAQELAARIAKNAPFVPPAYLREAITAAARA